MARPSVEMLFALAFASSETAARVDASVRLALMAEQHGLTDPRQELLLRLVVWVDPVRHACPPLREGLVQSIRLP